MHILNVFLEVGKPCFQQSEVLLWRRKEQCGRERRASGAGRGERDSAGGRGQQVGQGEERGTVGGESGEGDRQKGRGKERAKKKYGGVDKSASCTTDSGPRCLPGSRQDQVVVRTSLLGLLHAS